MPLVEATTTIALLHQQSGLGRKTLAQLLDQAHARSLALGRAPREAFQLARLLVVIGVTTDTRLYYRHAPAWLAQLERDSGLCDYREVSSVAPEKRLSSALQAAASRYAAAPERERVYRVDEAIRQLTAFVGVSLGVIHKANDLELSASLPELLAPFSALSPALDTLWQFATTVNEYHNGLSEQARTRTLQVYARLLQLSGHEIPYLDELRRGLVAAAAAHEVELGYPSAESWIVLMDNDPLHRVSAQHLRRVLRILDGDAAGALSHSLQAELLAAQSGAMSAFDPPTILELNAQAHAGDLTGVKQAADRIAQGAGEWPGWRALHEYAQGCFQRLRGDLPRARTALERALSLSDPQTHDTPLQPVTWILAAAAYIHVLSELGDCAQARAFGLQVLERVDALGITTGGSDHVRALALAEAKLGEHATAAARLDRLIAERSHLRPSMLARDLEARARVAIWAKDSAAASHFIQLATANAAGGVSSASLSKRGRLLDEARSAGVAVEVPRSEFESAVLQRHRPAALAPTHLLESVARLTTSAARAKQVLTLLTQATGATAGHLYYVQQTRLVCVATLGLTPDPALDEFAQGFAQHWLTQVAMTTIFTDVDEGAGPALKSWTDRAGKTHAIAMLLPSRAAKCVGLVALSGGGTSSTSREFGALSTALADHLLLVGDLDCLVSG